MIRPARPDEASSLSALALRSKAHWGYDAALMRAFAPELTLSERDIADRPTYVLEVDARPRASEPKLDANIVGFYALEACDERRMELYYLFVEPAEIGHGYGRALLDHAKACAIALGRRTLIIQSDPHATGFYTAAGGRRAGERFSDSIPGRALPLFEIDLSAE